MDNSAIRDFLQKDSTVANEIKEELEQASVTADQVVSLTVRQPSVVVALVREDD